MAALLFSLATSSSEQSAPESTAGALIVGVTREQPQKTAPVPVPKLAAPVPHAPVLPNHRTATQPRSAAPHPPVRHELSKFAPTAPPNPTPAPVRSSEPNPVPTQPAIAVSPAAIEAVVPTSAPAQIVAAAIKVPPTAAPVPKPRAVPTIVPSHAPAPTAAPKAVSTPRPEPSALVATEAPIIAMATPQPLTKPGSPNQQKIPRPAPTAAHGTAATPGPRPLGTPGPKGVTPSKSNTARPIQAPPATPRPSAIGAAKAKRPSSLNQRLQNLLPSPSASVTPEPSKHYSFLNGLVPTPEPEPTPPPSVIAATKFLYQENVGSQRWKQSYLGTAPEEGYVKMYVTSVHYVLGVRWCKGWVVRAPLAGTKKWIVETGESYICSGRMTPFTPSSPQPP